MLPGFSSDNAIDAKGGQETCQCNEVVDPFPLVFFLILKRDEGPRKMAATPDGEKQAVLSGPVQGIFHNLQGLGVLRAIDHS